MTGPGGSRAIADHLLGKEEIRRSAERNPAIPERIREITRWLEAELRACGLALEVKKTPPDGAAIWSKQFQLTQAETRLALHLLNGGTPGTYAAALGLSQHTVRNQLRSIYAKTNTNRQVSLLQLLLRASGKNP